MRLRAATLLSALVAIAIWETALRPQLVTPSFADGPAPESAVKDNAELAQMYAEDQSDRMPKEGKAIDWKVVGPRDKARMARMREMYLGAKLQTGADYYHAAMILQHSDAPADYLLAHELCVVAISKGEPRARWLAAASEDRFLTSIGRPQRFGTQYKADGPNQPYRLCKVEDGITDDLRRALNVPTLKDARAREAELNDAPSTKGAEKTTKD